MLRSFLVVLAVLMPLSTVCPLDRIGDSDLAAWVDQQVRDWQPKPEEKRFDEIGWAVDIREALRLGKEHGRPVFLFTHDGRMGVGRC